MVRKDILGKSAMAKVTSWVKEYSGLGTMGICIVAALTLIGAFGWWGISAQDKRIDDRLTSEVNRLESAITNIRNDVGRIESKIDTLGKDLGIGAENQRKRIDEIYKILVERLPSPQ